MAGDDDVVSAEPTDLEQQDGSVTKTTTNDFPEVPEIDLLQETQRELAAARQEIERFQFFSCQLQEDFQAKLAALQETNLELDSKLRECLQEKDDLCNAMASQISANRPPTMSELRERKDCEPIAVLIHDKILYTLVEKRSAAGVVSRRFWSIVDEIPGGRLGGKVHDGEEWGVFRGEEQTSVLDVPVFVSMRKEQIVDFEQQVLEFNRQKVLLEQSSDRAAKTANSNIIQVYVRDADDATMREQMRVLKEEIDRLNAAKTLTSNTDNNMKISTDAQAPPVDSGTNNDDSQISEQSRKLQMLEQQLRESERWTRVLEQELFEAIVKIQSRTCSEPPDAARPLPVQVPPLERPALADAVSAEYKLHRRNEELEAEVKRLAEELTIDSDKYQMLQLKQSVVYMLSQIPENNQAELELTIQTVIGLLGLDKEARERLAIKRTRLGRGWR